MVDGAWAKVGEHLKDGDRIKILDAGQIVDGDYGPRKVFRIMTTKKEELNLSFNQTSLNNLVDGFGEESEHWMGKVVNVFIVKQRVGDGLKNVCYLAPENWTMDDDGQFGPKEKLQSRDDIDDSNIPF